MELFPTEIAQSIPYVQELSQKAMDGWDAFPASHLVDFVLSYKWINFYIPEFQSLAELKLGPLPPLIDVNTPYQGMPFLQTKLTDKDVMKFITKRSVFVNGCHEILARSTTIEGLFDAVQAIPRDQFRDMDDDKTFSIQVTTYNSKLTRNEQERIRRKLMFLKPTGKVNLSNPSVTYTIFIDCVPVNSINGTDLIPTEYRDKRKVLPYVFYFTRQIACKSIPDWYVPKYDLSKRPYIGPTSCDNYLAFAMSNLAQVDAKSTVLDPFSGTGSILLSAARFSPIVVGQDLDFNVLHAKMRGKTANIWDNFTHHQYQRPELLCADSTRPPYRLQNYHDTQKQSPHPPCTIISPGCHLYKTRYSQPIDEINEQIRDEQMIGEQEQIDLMYQEQAQFYTKTHEQWVLKQQQQQQPVEEDMKMHDDTQQPTSTESETTITTNNSHDDLETPYKRIFQRTLFDAIICDPPYGIRARANKIGTSSKDEIEQPTIASPEDLEAGRHYPSTIHHALHNVILDLFDFAAQTLHIGKRLCFLFPSARNLPIELMPTHPCFKLVAHPAQPMTTWFTRRCMVYEKICSYDPSIHSTYGQDLYQKEGIPLWSLTVLDRARRLAGNQHWFDVDLLYKAKALLERCGMPEHQRLSLFLPKDQLEQLLKDDDQFLAQTQANESLGQIDE